MFLIKKLRFHLSIKRSNELCPNPPNSLTSVGKPDSFYLCCASLNCIVHPCLLNGWRDISLSGRVCPVDQWKAREWNVRTKISLTCPRGTTSSIHDYIHNPIKFQNSVVRSLSGPVTLNCRKIVCEYCNRNHGQHDVKRLRQFVLQKIVSFVHRLIFARTTAKHCIRPCYRLKWCNATDEIFQKNTPFSTKFCFLVHDNVPFFYCAQYCASLSFLCFLSVISGRENKQLKQNIFVFVLKVSGLIKKWNKVFLRSEKL